MNSDVNSNEDVLYEQFLNWLLQKSESDDLPFYPEESNPELDTEELDSSPREQDTGENDEFRSRVATTNLEQSRTMNKFSEPSSLEHDFLEDPLDWEEDLDNDFFESNKSDLQLDEPEQSQSFDISAPPLQPYPLEMNKMTMVEQRFQEILKRKLRSEIEHRPPRFPWETKISEYESEFELEQSSSEVRKIPQPLWVPQLVNFPLPMELPEKLLTSLLQSCLEALQSPFRQTAKIKRAVSQVFPEQTDILSNLVVSPIRDTQQLQTLRQDSQETSPSQQMALSILLSQKIFDTLTLRHRRSQTILKRQWLTTAGLVIIHSEYHPLQGKTPNDPLQGSVTVRVKLPQGGTVKLQTATASTVVERIYPGQVSLELVDWEPRKFYPLEIYLSHDDQTPLIFILSVDD